MSPQTLFFKEILVIDDNEILLQLVSEMLEKAGHQVEPLNTPESFEVTLRKIDFDLINKYVN